AEQLSAILRQSLIEQMAAINSADEAAAWAHRSLPAKNTLTLADAKIVEERFAARLCALGEGQEPDGPSNGPPSVGTPGNLTPADGPPHSVADQIVRDARGSTAGTSQNPRGPKTQSVLWAKRFAYATRTTADSCCGSHALCAAACRRIRITSRLHNPARL